MRDDKLLAWQKTVDERLDALEAVNESQPPVGPTVSSASASEKAAKVLGDQKKVGE